MEFKFGAKIEVYSERKNHGLQTVDEANFERRRENHGLQSEDLSLKPLGCGNLYRVYSGALCSSGREKR